MGATASAEGAPGRDSTGLGAEVRAAVGGLYRRFRSVRPDGALGDSTLDVLLFLSKNGPQTLTSLSTRAGVTPASMSQSVNRLTSSGYAVRVPDPADRRRVLFATTPEGDRLAASNRMHRDAWLDARLAEFSPEERATISRACALLATITDSRN